METDNVEARLKNNPQFASLLRQRLESRHGVGALREALAQLTDAQLVEKYLANEKQGREHTAKRRAEKAAE
jgi:hypothetical protein